MFFPLLLTAISFITHFLFFGRPAAVVFDEVYMGSFVSSYSSGSYYFDIHPPLAKLIEKFFGDLIGAPYNVDFSAIGNTLPWGVILLRLLPVIAGMLLPVVIYFIARNFNFSKVVSFAAGALIILENSLLTQSRFILFDSIMLLFGFSAILLYQLYVKKRYNKWFLVGSALLAAGAFSIKWTGLAFPLLILIMEIVRVWDLKGKMKEKVMGVGKFLGVYAVVGIVVYLSAFAVHLGLLDHTGPGDAFMTPRFQKSLIGNPNATNPNLKPKGFFGKTIELNLEMLDANQTLTATHPYSSKWYTWPVMLRPVFYWQGTRDATGNAYIYLLGNPLIYWLGTLSVLFLLVRMVIMRKFERIPLIIVIGYLVNFLPFIFIGRVMFIYHYQAALVMSILAIAYILEKYIKEKYKKVSIAILLLACLTLFIFFSPLSYGLHLTDSELSSRTWLSSWR